MQINGDHNLCISQKYCFKCRCHRNKLGHCCCWQGSNNDRQIWSTEVMIVYERYWYLPCRGPLYQHGLTFISAWIFVHMIRCGMKLFIQSQVASFATVEVCWWGGGGGGGGTQKTKWETFDEIPGHIVIFQMDPFEWLMFFNFVRHRRRRALSSFHAPVRSSIRPSVCLPARLSRHMSVYSERHYHSNSLRLSAIGLNFGGIMHNTLKQNAAKNGRAQPILPVPRNFKIFHIRLGPGMTDDVTALTL